MDIVSLPSRERGLKYRIRCKRTLRIPVAPLAGAWIEIVIPDNQPETVSVAPLAGAWIEIAFLRSR